MKTTRENRKPEAGEQKDKQKEVETIVPKNQNVHPIPSKEDLEKKKKSS